MKKSFFLSCFSKKGEGENARVINIFFKMSLFLKIKHFAVIKWDQPKAFSRHKKSFFSVFLSLSSFPQLFIQLWLLSTRPFFTSFLSFILLWSRKNLLGKKSRKAPHFYFIYWTYTSLRLDGMAKNYHLYLRGYARARNFFMSGSIFILPPYTREKKHLDNAVIEPGLPAPQASRLYITPSPLGRHNVR